MITVIIPFFNSARFLQETIDSVLEQTYSDWECLLIDDGSTDGSETIAKSAQRQDSRFKYHFDTAKVRGVSASRNSGIELAKGEYLMFLDSDDLLEPSALESRWNVMQKSPELDIAFFQVQAFGLESFRFTPVLEDYLEAFLSFDFPFQTSSSFWKTSFVRALEGFRTDMTHLEDPEFHMQALAAGPKISVLPDSQPDVRYRVWKTKSIDLTESLVSEIRSYVRYIESALAVCERTGSDKIGLQKGLYLMLMRVRWAFNDEIYELIRTTIDLLDNQEVLTPSRTKKLLYLLSQVDHNRPRLVLELMAVLLYPLEHLSVYKGALSQRSK